MARSRRRSIWLDQFTVVEQVISGGSGAVNDELVTSSVIEGLGGNATIIRIVGTVSLRSLTARPTVLGFIWVAPSYASATLPTIVATDEIARMRTMWTVYRNMDLADDTVHIPIDIRTQRKLGQGVRVVFSYQNLSMAGNDASVSYHFRSLILLP